MDWVKFELNSSQLKLLFHQVKFQMVCDHSTFFLDESVQYYRICPKHLDQLVILPMSYKLLPKSNLIELLQYRLVEALTYTIHLW